MICHRKIHICSEDGQTRSLPGFGFSSVLRAASGLNSNKIGPMHQVFIDTGKDAL